MQIITVANQKGGVGKTSTAHILTTGLLHTGCKVLAVDCDPQTNFSFISGAIGISPNLYDLFTKKATIEEVIYKTSAGYDLLPGSTELLGADKTLTGYTQLREILKPVSDKYDYIVIDCPPQIGTIVFNALATSNIVITPVMADVLSLQGLSQLSEAIQTIKKAPVSKGGNPYLEHEGILLTKYSDRANLSRDIREGLIRQAEALGTKVFKTTIREAVAVKEVQFAQGDLFRDYPRAKVTADCKAFIKELTRRKVK